MAGSTLHSECETITEMEMSLSFSVQGGESRVEGDGLTLHMYSTRVRTALLLSGWRLGSDKAPNRPKEHFSVSFP